MRLRRVLAAVLVAAGAVVGWAPSVQAQPPGVPPEVLEGMYDYHEDGRVQSNWEIYPICVPTVGDLREPLYLPVACRLHVTRSGQPGNDAVMIGGLWTIQFSQADGLKCPDGSTAPVQQTLSWNGLTLAGTRKTLHDAECGLQPGMTTTPFHLTFREPLPVPVDRYPLICEPGGLRRCF